jgi:DNA-binding NtrC family response regulator
MQDESAAAVHVLVVDDEPGLRRTLVRLLDARGFRVGAVENGVEGLAYIEEHRPDVALVDMQMPKMGGLELLACSKKAGLPTEIIVMTANAGVDAAVEAVKGGAYYFLTKPFVSTEAVALVVAQAAQRKRLLDKTHRLEQRLEAQERFGGLIGNSARMRAVYKLIEGVATATSAVLIVGETGTGKELVARAIHQRSARSDKPFVALNCAAIPRELVESELFGHVRGAFTGAQNARAGLFETAHTGTIFLDEVGDLPLAAQVKLLRTLQEGEIKRVGADETKLVDVRVVSATNVDLKTCIAAGTFRSDLFYRLNVIAIEIPPLRERGEDILLLAHHFIHKYSRRMAREPRPLSPEAAGALGTYAWPGNVRELEHAIERAVVLAPGPSIAQSDLPSEVQRAQGAVTSRPIASSAAPVEDAPTMGEELANLPYAEAKRVAMARFEEVYLEAVLRRAGGNLSEAARQAGVDRSNFKRLVRKGKV